MPEIVDMAKDVIGKQKIDPEVVIEAAEQNTSHGVVAQQAAEVAPGMISSDSFMASGVHGGTLMPAGAADDLYVVDTQDIRNTAELAAGHLSAIDELVSEAQQEMAATEEVWIGQAGNWYRDVFLTSTNKYKKVLEEFGTSYTRELIAYADKHEGADSRATTIAEEAAEVSV